MQRTTLRGSPAHGLWSTVADVSRFLTEVVHPGLVALSTAREAVCPQYPDLGGIVPGVGRFERSPWGLGFEIRGAKEPHWTGARNTPSTFGHFGGAGTMMWIDPEIADAPLGVVALTDRPFDEWANAALASWTTLSDAVIADQVGVSG